MNTGCILQVEDEANEVFLLQQAFARAGILTPVHVATDGQMAIEYLSGAGKYMDRQRFPVPFVVLLDLKLPRRSGREVLEWIHGQPHLNRLVVIVFTSAQYAGDVDLAYALGAKSFVYKPSDFSGYLAFAELFQSWWLRRNQFPPATDALGLSVAELAAQAARSRPQQGSY